LSYDQDALEMLDTIDGTGTTVPAVPSEPGSVELDIDGATQTAAIRFLARAGMSRSVNIAVAAQLWDQAGNALPSAALGPHSIMVDP
jgi:hypothetical protein